MADREYPPQNYLPYYRIGTRYSDDAGSRSRWPASAACADVCACDWADLGEFPMAGFPKAQRVFGLRDKASGIDRVQVVPQPGAVR